MRILLLLGLAVLGACAARGPANDAVTTGRVAGIAGVAPRYQAAFQALKDALDNREDETARRILGQIQGRIAADRARETEAIRTARPEEAPPRTTEDAALLAEGFGRILDGRARVDTMQLELILRRIKNEDSLCRVVLRGTTSHTAPLTFRPGPGTLRVQRVTISPTGNEGRSVSEASVQDLEELVLDPDGSVEVPLGTFPVYSGPGSLAARTTWSLHFRSGAVLQGEESYPAMMVDVGKVERIDLAPFLPTAPVAPEELAAYVQRPDANLPPIVERTVRIPEDQHEAALELLAPVAARFTHEEMRRLVPCLRWLGRTSAPGGDPLAWKLWIERWYEARTAPAASNVDLGEKP